MKRDKEAEEAIAAILEAVTATFTAMQLVGNSREKSLALTKLEECLMWADKAVIRNQLRRQDSQNESVQHDRNQASD